MRKSIVCILLILCCCWTPAIFSHECRLDTLSVSIYFPHGISKLDSSYSHNNQAIESIRTIFSSPGGVTSVVIRGGASPEGIRVNNKRLSEKRAINLESYITGHFNPSMQVYTDSAQSDIDWLLLARLVEKSGQQWSAEVIDIINNVPEWIFDGGKVVDGRKHRLGMLRDRKSVV